MSSRISFPFAGPPAYGKVTEAADGVLWARLPLPFQLDHLNVYLLEDDGGWAAIDTGVDDPVCRKAWETLFLGPLAGTRLSRVIVTHFHPDHVGLAGWLCERHDAPLVTTATCHEVADWLRVAPETSAAEWIPYYVGHGLTSEEAAAMVPVSKGYGRYVGPLPDLSMTAEAGSTLTIGGRIFGIRYGHGHSADQLMLHCDDADLFLSADQVIARITPYVGVEPHNSDADTLGQFLETLRQVRSGISNDALVLPGHELPFWGLAERCEELVTHHEERCMRVLKACSERARPVADLLPLMFSRALDSGSMAFAVGEALAHVNFMAERGILGWSDSRDGVRQITASGTAADLAAVFGAYGCCPQAALARSARFF